MQFSYHGNYSLEIEYKSGGERNRRLKPGKSKLVGLANRGIGNEGMYFEAFRKYDGKTATFFFVFDPLGRPKLKAIHGSLAYMCAMPFFQGCDSMAMREAV